MPLPLDHNRWNSLKTVYNMPATDVVEWLETAYRSGMTDEQSIASKWRIDRCNF